MRILIAILLVGLLLGFNIGLYWNRLKVEDAYSKANLKTEQFDSLYLQHVRMHDKMAARISYLDSLLLVKDQVIQNHLGFQRMVMEERSKDYADP
jgi:hypothetical protein